ncbi:MAG TPA: hypothetical protein VGQ00_03080 [Candidatus Norongarragalinales archaeon]|jgi:hypothetical protein|nr:hypothetical protein [Candidatus Norongarragalinales archaeon]
MSKFEKFLAHGHPVIIIRHLVRMQNHRNIAQALAHEDQNVREIARARLMEILPPKKLFDLTVALIGNKNEVVSNQGVWLLEYAVSAISRAKISEAKEALPVLQRLSQGLQPTSGIGWRLKGKINDAIYRIQTRK